MGKSKTTTTTTTTTTSTTPIPPGQLNITNTITHAPSTHTPSDHAISTHALSAVPIVQAEETLSNMPENIDKETIDRSGHFYFAKGPKGTKRKVLFAFESNKSVVTFTTVFDDKYRTEALSSSLGKIINTKQLGKVSFKSSTIQITTGKERLPVLEMRSAIKDKELANKHLLKILTGIFDKRKHKVVLSKRPTLELNNLMEENSALLTEAMDDTFVTEGMFSFSQPNSIEEFQSEKQSELEKGSEPKEQNLQPEEQDLQAEKQNEETNQLSQSSGQKVFFPFLMGGNVQFLFDDYDATQEQKDDKKRKAELQDVIEDKNSNINEDETGKQKTKQQKTSKINAAQIEPKIITLETGDKISNIFKMKNGKEIHCEIENDKVKFIALNAEANYSPYKLCAALKKRFRNPELCKFITFSARGAEGSSCYMKLKEGQPTITLHKALKELRSEFEPANGTSNNGPKEPDDLKEVNIDTVNATETSESFSIFDPEYSYLLDILNSPRISAEIDEQSQKFYSPQSPTFFSTPRDAEDNSETPSNFYPKQK